MKGSVVAACRKSGLKRSSVYWRKDHDEGFKATWDFALQCAVARFEQAAIQRGVVGYEEPVFGSLPGEHSGSGIIGYRRVYSDRLLLRVLEAHDPRYRKHADVAPTNLTINVVTALTNANEAARERAKKLAQAAAIAPTLEHKP